MDHFDHLCNEGIIKDKSHGTSSKGVDDLFVAMTHVQETVLKAVKDLSVQRLQQLQDELKGIQTKKDLQSRSSDLFIHLGFPLWQVCLIAFMAPVLSSPLEGIAPQGWHTSE
ncbi:hypothetical protein APHAL10511_003396 [Amanita phalloides]|nr:hypothetical protein APHAL10511_003396 [Amanita phalloides]